MLSHVLLKHFQGREPQMNQWMHICVLLIQKKTPVCFLGIVGLNEIGKK